MASLEPSMSVIGGMGRPPCGGVVVFPGIKMVFSLAKGAFIPDREY